jgi:hypothetical protein
VFYLHTEHILFHEIKYVLYVHSFSIRTEHLGFPGGAAGAMEERVLLSLQNKSCDWSAPIQNSARAASRTSAGMSAGVVHICLYAALPGQD